MDGRTQLPVIHFLKKKFEVEFVDSITEPGPNGILANDEYHSLVDSIFSRVDISVFKHNSTGIAIVGHHDCAGNPGPKEQQLQQTGLAVDAVARRYPDLKVIGLWVDENWIVHLME